MIRRSPAEVYLKYLILHPKRFQDSGILEACEYAQLDGVNARYISRLRGQLPVPKDFAPFDKNHWPSQSFLIKQGLHSIFFPDSHGKKAFELLKLARIKEFIE